MSAPRFRSAAAKRAQTLLDLRNNVAPYDLVPANRRQRRQTERELRRISRKIDGKGGDRG